MNLKLISPDIQYRIVYDFLNSLRSTFCVREYIIFKPMHYLQCVLLDASKKLKVFFRKCLILPELHVTPFVDSNCLDVKSDNFEQMLLTLFGITQVEKMSSKHPSKSGCYT